LEVKRLAIQPHPLRAYQVEEQPIAQEHEHRASEEQGEGTRTELAARMLAEVVWPRLGAGAGLGGGTRTGSRGGSRSVGASSTAEGGVGH
ncbi:hypothetical protein JCM24511_03469, partial [Saitozyma sp. JCM 24511]